MATSEEIFTRPFNIGPNAARVYDLMDSLSEPPDVVTSEYVLACQRACSLLRKSTPLIRTFDYRSYSLLRSLAFPPGYLHPFGSIMAPVVPYDENSRIDLRDDAFRLRKVVLDVMAKANSIMNRAKQAAVPIASNPFLTVANLIRERERDPVGNVVVTETDASNIITDLSALLDFLDAVDNGRIDLERDVFNASQISSFDLSLDGFGYTGPIQAGLSKFIPTGADIENLRTRQDRETNVFRYKIPRVVFISDYSPDGERKGALIGFMKIPDASGYQVRKRNVFTGEVEIFTKTSTDLDVTTKAMIDYAKAWCMNFYDVGDDSKIVIFYDENVVSDCLFSYSLMAFQNLSKGKSLFDVPYRNANVPSLPRGDRESLNSSVNQWERISTTMHGSPYYDWAVCGVSMRDAEVRNLSLETRITQYSYIAKTVDVPTSDLKAASQIQDVMRSYYDHVNRAGLDSAFKELLIQTGVVSFFESNDSLISFYSDRQRLSNSGPRTSRLLAAVEQAIDERMATVDLNILTKQVSQLFDDFRFSNGRNGQILPKLKALTSFDSDGVVDVLTPRGISTVFRLLRSFAIAEQGVFKAIEDQIAKEVEEAARKQRELDAARERAEAQRQAELDRYKNASVSQSNSRPAVPGVSARTNTNTIRPIQQPVAQSGGGTNVVLSLKAGGVRYIK